MLATNLIGLTFCIFRPTFVRKAKKPKSYCKITKLPTYWCNIKRIKKKKLLVWRNCAASDSNRYKSINLKMYLSLCGTVSTRLSYRFRKQNQRDLNSEEIVTIYSENDWLFAILRSLFFSQGPRLYSFL